MTELRDTTILVTGADGFIGSHLVERLLQEGAAVRAFCLYNSNGSAGWLDDLDPYLRDGIDVRFGDIRDAEFVREATRGVDLVAHLAALIAIPYSYTAPRSFVETNITGTLNVLEAARQNEFRLVSASTSEVYGTPQEVPITEGHPLQGQSPYSASKIAADKLCESYARSFDTPVTVLRPFNTFGPRQSARAVIPVILSQLLTGVSEVRLGALTPKRDFTFVSDTVDGFVRALATDLAPGEVIQLGTGEAVSIGEVFDLCADLLGVSATAVSEEERLRPANSEVGILLSNPARAEKLLGWSAQVGLAEGLKRTAEWLAPRADRRTAIRFQR